MRAIFFCLLSAALLCCSGLKAVELNPAVAAWLTAQTNINSWSADFVQTRSLKSLTQPLMATGTVWFAAPNRFRWEVRKPQETIAVRTSDQLLVIYPRLKRVERYPLASNQSGPWKDALALLQVGFPRSAAELEAQYAILEQQTENSLGLLVLQPKSVSARRMIAQIRIEFELANKSLRATTLQFADGSSLRNDFNNAVLNPPTDSQLFAAEIPKDFKIIEPLSK